MNKKAIREHVEACPLGWWQGTVRTARKTTDADIIAWLAKLRELVGLDTVDGEVEHGS